MFDLDDEPALSTQPGVRPPAPAQPTTRPAPRPVQPTLPGGIHGGGYPPQRERFYRLFAEGQHGLSLHLLRQDSQTEASRDAVLAALGGQPVDFLFIDGDHRYPGVSRDYALYAPLVRPGGLIAFHDIRPNRFDPSIEVWRLWDEIKASGAPAREFIHEPYGGRYGIGVVEWMG